MIHKPTHKDRYMLKAKSADSYGIYHVFCVVFPVNIELGCYASFSPK